MAIYGLAGLGEPVLLAAHQLLAEPELTPSEQLYAMLAAAALGDLEAVRPHYRSFVAAYGEEVALDLRIAVDGDRDEQLQATALTAVLAARLGEPEALPMLGYLAQNQPGESLINLELVLAARSGLEGLKGAPVGLTYRLKGEVFEKTLQPGERLAMALLPDESGLAADHGRRGERGRGGYLHRAGAPHGDDGRGLGGAQLFAGA